MTLTPILAYYLTAVLLTQNSVNGWFAIPGDLLAKGSDPYLYLKIGGTITLVFLVYILFMLVTFLTYKLFGPSRLGPTDVPQIGITGKKHSR